MVLSHLATDTAFIELVLKLITTPLDGPRAKDAPAVATTTPPAAELGSMLLANLAKHGGFPRRILEMQKAPVEGMSKGENSMDQLMDCFVRGEKEWDYLAYVFADVSRVWVFFCFFYFMCGEGRGGNSGLIYI